MELVFLALLVVLMAAALGSGYPVAFALPGSAILTIAAATACGYLFAGDPGAYFAQGDGGQWLSAGVLNLRGVYWEVERDTLIAIPLFIFMGIMLQRSKIAEDLLITMAQLFGPVPGGLGISVVFVGALLAATTGIVGATVVAMGLISLPAMLRNNYSKSLATGTIAASGTLGQIIPPSIVLIILADQLASATDQASTLRKALHKETTGELSMPSAFDVTSTSAGEMFLGALVPGLVLVALYMIYILVYAMLRPHVAPPVRSDKGFNAEFFFQLGLALVPPLALIFLVLGSIISGIATVNQAGAIGAAGALLMAGYRLTQGERNSFTPAILSLLSLAVIGAIVANFNTNIKSISNSTDAIAIALALVAVTVLLTSLIWSAWRAYKIENTLGEVMIETAKATSLVFIILLGAAMLTAAFRAFGGEELVKHFLEGIPGGFWAKFITVMAVIFVLGFFLDFIEIAVVVVPIVAPILLADPSANITAVWLGVMIGLNIQTSFLTPPFGFALFYLRGVAPAIVKTIDMYKGVIAFIVLQLIALVIVANYPPLVNYLPNRVSFLSETAPPPRNPRIQYCVEEYIHGQLVDSGTALSSAAGAAGKLDASFLPKNISKDFLASFDGVEKAKQLLIDAKAAEAAVAAAAVEYRPVHRTVRALQRDARVFEVQIKGWETDLSRLRGDEFAAAREKIEARVAIATENRDALLAQIPAQWEERHATFAKLTNEENKIRTQFRRQADGIYQGISTLSDTLAGSKAYSALAMEFGELRDRIANGDASEMHEVVNQFAKKLDMEGASKVKSGLNKVRRALKKKKPDVEKALKEFDRAEKAYNKQLEWRAKAEGDFTTGVASYQNALRSTIGMRQQNRMTREQGLFVASCQSGHRDISLNF
ncbi:MAG: TRAP transporter large permease subunit [Rhizobiaceae bacterium]|nr:TRAP transporter large permease subunit [Rhizobiaceae bacterium]